MDRKFISSMTYFGIIVLILISGSYGRHIDHHNKVILDSDVVEFSYVSLNKTIDNVTVSLVIP